MQRPSEHSTLEKITVFDRRETLPPTQIETDQATIEEIFQGILENSESLEDDELIRRHQERLDQTLSEVDGSEKADIPLIHLAEFALGADKIEEERKRLFQERNEAIEAGKSAAEIEIIKNSLRSLELTAEAYRHLKIKLLTYLIAQPLKTEKGAQLKQILTNQIIDIQRERHNQGRELYDHDAIVLFVYQNVYRFYLWQGELRKDGKTSYFLSHIVEAIQTLIDHGFTGAPTLHAASGHDDIEDLRLHRTDPHTPNSPSKPREEWFFCPIEVYAHHLTGDPEYARRVQRDIHEKAWTTVQGVTHHYERPESQTEEGEEPSDERRQRELDNERRFYQGLIDHGPHPALVRVAEQPFNFETIKNLAPERQSPKLESMIRNWPKLSRNLEIWGVYIRMMKACVDYYAPALRPRFESIQRDRILSRLRRQSFQRGMRTLLDILLTTQKTDGDPLRITEEITQWIETMGTTPTPEIEAARHDLAHRIHEACTPFLDEIVTIEIIPKPLEHPDYLPSIEALREDPHFFPEIREDDPLHEILILVEDDADVYPTALKIAQHIQPDSGIHPIDPLKPEHGRPYRGITLCFDDQELGPEITLRINSRLREANAKRGIFSDPKGGLPLWLRRRIRYANEEIEDGTLTPGEAVDRIITIPDIMARSAIGFKKRLRLGAYATFLDAARAISAPTLQRAKKAYRVPKRGVDGKPDFANRVEVHLSDRVQDGDSLIIEIGDEGIELETIPFMEDPLTRQSARAYFDLLLQDETRREAETILEKRVENDEILNRAKAEIVDTERQLAETENALGKTPEDDELQKKKRRLENKKSRLQRQVEGQMSKISSHNDLERERQRLRDTRHIARAEEYLENLRHVFGIKDRYLLGLLAMHRQKHYPEAALEAVKNTLQEALNPSGAEEEKIDISEGHIAHFLAESKRGGIKAALNNLAQRCYGSAEGSGLSIEPASVEDLETKIQRFVDDYQEARRKTLTPIGNARYNPLKALSALVDRSKDCIVQVTVPADQPGILGILGIELGQAQISINPDGSDLGKTDPETGQTHMNLALTIPKHFTHYDLLKFILKLHIKYREKGWNVSIDPELFSFAEEGRPVTNDSIRLAQEMGRRMPSVAHNAPPQPVS